MILQKIAKLIDVKSIISLTLTGVFSALAATGVIAADLFVPIYMTVIGFYFGTQYQKKQNTINET